MNNGFQQMWAEIKNLWNHALTSHMSQLSRYLVSVITWLQVQEPDSWLSNTININKQ